MHVGRDVTCLWGLKRWECVTVLTIRDGAVSGVMIKPVDVLPAFWTEIERTWWKENSQVIIPKHHFGFKVTENSKVSHL